MTNPTFETYRYRYSFTGMSVHCMFGHLIKGGDPGYLGKSQNHVGSCPNVQSSAMASEKHR